MIRNHATAFSSRLAQPPRTASRTAGQRNPVHGIRPATTIQIKKCHGCTRLAAVVVKRNQCSKTIYRCTQVGLCSAASTCQGAAIVLGAAAPTPHRAKAAEQTLRGKPIDEALARTAAHAALQGAAPLSKNAYKLPIFETLVRRAILAAARRA